MAVWELTFPRSLDQDALISFLSSLHGLARSRPLPWEPRPTVTIETEGTLSAGTTSALGGFEIGEPRINPLFLGRDLLPGPAQLINFLR